MKQNKFNIFSLLYTIVLISFVSCTKSSSSSIIKEAIEIEGIKIGMTEREVADIPLEYDTVTIGGVGGMIDFIFGSDGKLDRMFFAFESSKTNAIRKSVKSKYPIATFDNATMYKVEDTEGTILLVGDGVLFLSSQRYNKEQSEKFGAELIDCPHCGQKSSAMKPNCVHCGNTLPTR